MAKKKAKKNKSTVQLNNSFEALDQTLEFDIMDPKILNHKVKEDNNDENESFLDTLLFMKSHIQDLDNRMGKYMKDQTEINLRLANQLQKADEKIKKLELQIIELKSNSGKIESGKHDDDGEKDYEDMNTEIQRPKSKLTRFKNRLEIWGTSKIDCGMVFNQDKFCTFAVSKIPNEPKYDENWLNDALSKNFKENGFVNGKIESSSRIPAYFENCATKSFKVTVRIPGNFDTVRLYESDIWLSGTRVTRYRTKKN